MRMVLFEPACAGAPTRLTRIFIGFANVSKLSGSLQVPDRCGDYDGAVFLAKEDASTSRPSRALREAPPSFVSTPLAMGAHLSAPRRIPISVVWLVIVLVVLLAAGNAAAAPAQHPTLAHDNTERLFP
jgi:hypothetical protein